MRSWTRGRTTARRHGPGAPAHCWGRRFGAFAHADRLHERAIADRDAGRFTSALASAVLARGVLEGRRGESSPEAALVAHTIGTIREELSDYNGAGKAYDDATAIVNRHVDDDELMPLRIMIGSSAARLLRVRGRLDDAERIYVTTIEMAKRHYGTAAFEVAQLLNDLAVVYKYAARYDEAEAHYWRALRIIEATRGSRHVDVSTIWHNLGGIEHARGRFHTGEIYARRAVTLRQSTLGPDHVAVAKDVAALAALVQGQHRFDEAEQLLLRALNTFTTTFGPVHHEVAVSYNNLAALYVARGDYDRAEACYRRAINTKIQILGASHPDVAVSLHNAAMLAVRQGCIRRARDLFERALAIFENSLGAEHPKTVASQLQLANVSTTIQQPQCATSSHHRQQVAALPLHPGNHHQDNSFRPVRVTPATTCKRCHIPQAGSSLE